MTICERAQALYESGIALKRYNARSLLWRRNRRALHAALCKMLRAVLALQKQLIREGTHSAKHLELAVYMATVLCDCTAALYRRERGYRQAVSRRAWGFHNLPRAFLSVTDNAYISPEEARTYFRGYAK